MTNPLVVSTTNIIAGSVVSAKTSRLGGPWNISQDGLEFLKNYENFRAVLYNDSANHATIGYGHLVHRGPIDGRASERPFQGGISSHQGEALLRTDLSVSEAAVNRFARVPLHQHEYDAIVIFTFNIGVTEFSHSTALRRLNAGNYASVSSAMKMFNRAGGGVSNGLINRRAEEAEIFDSADYIRTR